MCGYSACVEIVHVWILCMCGYRACVDIVFCVLCMCGYVWKESATYAGGLEISMHCSGSV